MNKTTTRLSLLGLVLAAAATSAMAETIPMELEVGYRWVNVNGNQDMYKSQINEQSGFLIRSFTLSTNDATGSTGGFVDRFRIDVSDLGFGTGPAGSARLAAPIRRRRAQVAYPRPSVWATPMRARPAASCPGLTRRRSASTWVASLVPQVAGARCRLLRMDRS